MARVRVRQRYPLESGCHWVPNSATFVKVIRSRCPIVFDPRYNSLMSQRYHAVELEAVCVRVSMLRHCLVVFLAIVAVSCADDGMFSECPFSTSITQVCEGGESGAALSCVVESHPRCPEDICLSWKGSESVCTRTCDPANDSCPGGSSCQTFSAVESKYFCVEDSRL